MEDRINSLYIWLQQNGFQKEANLVKSAYGGGALSLGGASSLEEAAAFNESSLAGYNPFDPTNSDRAVDEIQILLDGAGLIPGFGEPADFVNAIIYIVREKYFEAALSLIALIPGLGIGATLLKRSANKAEAIREIARAAAAANIDPARIERLSGESIKLLKSSIELLRQNLPAEYARRIPQNAIPQVKAQIDQIIRGIKLSSEQAVSQGQRSVRHIVSSPSATYWRSLSAEFKRAIIDGSKATVEKALLRSHEYLGQAIKGKIKIIFPYIDDNLVSQIAEQSYRDISNISIILIDTADDMNRIFGDRAERVFGNYSLDSNIININLPKIASAASRFGSENILTRLFSTIKHEINHNLDEIIGRAHAKIVGNYDQMTGASLRYPSRLMGSPPPGGSRIPIIDHSFSGIKGSLLADSIQSALDKGVLRGSDYLTDHGEIMTRFTNLKGFINNGGPAELFAQIGFSFLTENMDLTNLLVKAGGGDVIALLKFIKEAAKLNNPLIRDSLQALDYGDDIFTLSSIINPAALDGDYAQLIKNIYNAV